MLSMITALHAPRPGLWLCRSSCRCHPTVIRDNAATGKMRMSSLQNADIYDHPNPNPNPNANPDTN